MNFHELLRLSHSVTVTVTFRHTRSHCQTVIVIHSDFALPLPHVFGVTVTRVTVQSISVLPTAMESLATTTNLAIVRTRAVIQTLTLWIAFTPKQLSDLQSRKPAWPDVYSKRFGLRTSPEKAVERAHSFMDWAPEGPRNQLSPKDFFLCRVEFSPLGYMNLVEQGVLLKYKDEEYRWSGCIHAQEEDSEGHLLYRLLDSVHTFL